MKDLRKIKRLPLIGCALMLLATGAGTAAAAPSATTQPKTSIVLDGYPLEFLEAPVIVQGTTMVPFRAIAEALQISVSWSNQTQSITAVKTVNGHTIKVVLRKNDKTALVNGEKIRLNVAPMSKNGSILVPLSFFSGQFGAKASWDGATRTVNILSPVEDMYTMAFYAINSFEERDLIDEFDSVSFGWARIGEDGKITLHGKDFYWPKPSGDITPVSIVSGAAAAGTSPTLMVAAMDGKGELTKLLNTPSLRDQAIDDTVKLASDNHFAGITLDFEGLGLTGDTAAAKASFTEFVRLLDGKAHAAGLKLTLALHPLNGSYRGYDYKKLAQYADELVIMAYDYSNESGPEPLDRVNEAIVLALKEVPKNKLILGINMHNENAGSVNAKIGLAKRYGLKGIAAWRIGLIGDDSIAAMKKTIKME